MSADHGYVMVKMIVMMALMRLHALLDHVQLGNSHVKMADVFRTLGIAIDKMIVMMAVMSPLGFVMLQI